MSSRSSVVLRGARSLEKTSGWAGAHPYRSRLPAQVPSYYCRDQFIFLFSAFAMFTPSTRSARTELFFRPSRGMGPSICLISQPETSARSLTVTPIKS